MNPFARKRGLAAAPKNPAVYADQVNAFMVGMSEQERARVVAATRTEGDIELRVRYLKDGSQSFSVWLCARGRDEGIKLIPAPLEDGPHAGDVR